MKLQRFWEWLKAVERLGKDLSATKLELRQVRANFEAVTDQQHYKRRKAETEATRAKYALQNLLDQFPDHLLDHGRSQQEVAILQARKILSELNNLPG